MRKNACLARWSISTFTSILLLLLNACSSNTTSHITYTYGNFSCPSNATMQPKNEFATLSLHSSGYQLRTKWQALSNGLSTESTPSSVSLFAELLGPFPSFDIARQVSQHDISSTNMSSPIIASISPIHTDDWTNKTYMSIIRLPPRLLPTYYIESEWLESVNNNGTTREAGKCILKITP